MKYKKMELKQQSEDRPFTLTMITPQDHGTELWTHPYQFIQDGIDHATGGDIVSVFNGLYVENVVVPKSLELIGEDKDNTVITGNDFGTVVKIIAEGVMITGFTITHSGSNPNNAGIMIHTPYNIDFQ